MAALNFYQSIAAVETPDWLTKLLSANQLRTFSRADTEHKVSADLHEGLNRTLLILKYRLQGNDERPAIKVVQDYDKLPVIDCFPGSAQSSLYESAGQCD